jgi:hypothetical protein
MGPGDEYRVKMLCYLDDDLHGQELADFRSHLEACKSGLFRTDLAHSFRLPVGGHSITSIPPGYSKNRPT